MDMMRAATGAHAGRERGIASRRQPDFLKLWAGQSVSLLGSEATRLALPLTAVVLLRATPAQLGLLTAAGYLPFLLLALPAGVWIDHRRRRPLLIAADLGRAALLALVPLLAVTGRLYLVALLAICFLIGVLTVVFEVAYQAFLPAVLPPGRLAAGNSALSASESVAEICGPGLGGLLVHVATAPVALMVDALSFVASATSLALIRRPEPCPPRATGRPGLRREIVEGVRFVWEDRLLRAFAGEAASYNVC